MSERLLRAVLQGGCIWNGENQWHVCRTEDIRRRVIGQVSPAFALFLLSRRWLIPTPTRPVRFIVPRRLHSQSSDWLCQFRAMPAAIELALTAESAPDKRRQYRWAADQACDMLKRRACEDSPGFVSQRQSGVKWSALSQLASVWGSDDDVDALFALLILKRSIATFERAWGATRSDVVFRLMQMLDRLHAQIVNGRFIAEP